MPYAMSQWSRKCMLSKSFISRAENARPPFPATVARIPPLKQLKMTSVITYGVWCGSKISCKYSCPRPERLTCGCYSMFCQRRPNTMKPTVCDRLRMEPARRMTQEQGCRPASRPSYGREVAICGLLQLCAAAPANPGLPIATSHVIPNFAVPAVHAGQAPCSARRSPHRLPRS